MFSNKKIVISIANGFQERLLIQSGFVEKLLEMGNFVKLIIPDVDIENGKDLARKYHNHIELIRFNSKLSLLTALYFDYRRVLLWRKSFQGAIKNYFQRQRKNKKKIAALGVSLLRIIPFEFKLLLDKFLMYDDEYSNVLKGSDLFVFTTGFVYQDVILSYAARRLKIPTVMIGQSWDNFSTKGYLTIKPDLILVWGNRMREEAVKFNDFPEEIIKVSGPLHFDFYHDFKRTCKKEISRKLLGLNPYKLTLIYGTSSILGCPGEIDVIRKLIYWVNTSPNNVLPYESQMIIRLHPDMVLGVNGQNIDNYIKFSSENVHVQVPKLGINSGFWYFKNQDKIDFSHALCASDIAVNCFSTFSIDAAVFNLPVITVAFDGDQKVPDIYSASRYENYTHIKGLLKKNGVQIARNYGELSHYIRQASVCPKKYERNRYEMLYYLVNKIDGRNTDRALSFINKIIFEL